MPALTQITEEPEQLRRCLRDLLALNALPALCQHQQEQQIAESTAEALVSVLGLEFVYISLARGAENAPKEVVRVGYALRTPATKHFRSSIASCLRAPPSSEAVRMANPLGAGFVQAIAVSIGLSAQEFLVAASKRASFPDQLERLLLSVAANQAALALQRRRAEQALMASETRYRELTENLEQRVAERTRELEADIIARMRAEQEAKQLEDKLRTTQAELARAGRRSTIGAMAASIAHEINQPLSALVTNGGIGLRLLTKADPDLEGVQTVLKRVIEDGHRASHIIAGIRAMFAKDSSDQSPVSIASLVCEVIELIQGELKSHHVSLRIELHEELPRVMANRVQLQQVILNLIMNAVEAMSLVDGGERSLLVKSELHGSGDVVITVEDSGPGIDPHDLNRVFDAFFTTKSHGMGLGLSICQSIIEAHGGRLWVSGRMPQGAIFHVQLPSDVSAGK